MKVRHLVYTVGLSAILSLSLGAQQGGFQGSVQQGGYKGPGVTTGVISVAEAKNLRDDARVMLNGKILRAIGHEKYLFSDGTDNITVDIDDWMWGNLSVNENDTVQITGEIDKEVWELEVEARSIKRLQ